MSPGSENSSGIFARMFTAGLFVAAAHRPAAAGRSGRYVVVGVCFPGGKAS